MLLDENKIILKGNFINMNIAGTQYTYSTKSLDIYLAGCKPPHCRGCQNPELFSFETGELFDDRVRLRIINKISEFNQIIDNIFIYGGEPLDQDLKELKFLLKMLKKTKKNIWLFTKYPIEEVPIKIKKYCSYIKCGKYDDQKLIDNYYQYGVKLASSNQIIYKLDNE